MTKPGSSMKTLTGPASSSYSLVFLTVPSMLDERRSVLARVRDDVLVLVTNPITPAAAATLLFLVLRPTHLVLVFVPRMPRHRHQHRYRSWHVALFSQPNRWQVRLRSTRPSSSSCSTQHRQHSQFVACARASWRLAAGGRRAASRFTLKLPSIETAVNVDVGDPERVPVRDGLGLGRGSGGASSTLS